jgi:hypothetical protein
MQMRDVMEGEMGWDVNWEEGRGWGGTMDG